MGEAPKKKKNKTKTQDKKKNEEYKRVVGLVAQHI